MDNSEEKVVAVIMVGGPTKGMYSTYMNFVFLILWKIFNSVLIPLFLSGVGFNLQFVDAFWQGLDFGLFLSIL